MSDPTPQADPAGDQPRPFWDIHGTLAVWALGVVVAGLVVLVAYGASRVNDRFVGSPVPSPPALENPAPMLPSGSARHGNGGFYQPP